MRKAGAWSPLGWSMPQDLGLALLGIALFVALMLAVAIGALWRRITRRTPKR